MDLPGFDQIDIAVNASALIPPALRELGIHADGQNIFPAIVDQLRQIELKGSVSAVAAAHDEIIAVNRGRLKSAFKLHLDSSALV